MAGPLNLGLKIAEGLRCSRCGSAMFVKRACGGWERQWLEVARCLRAGCAYTVGYRPRPGRPSLPDAIGGRK
jgi:hypothetical protein